MLLDDIYGLLNLFEFKINHFNSLVQAKSEFKNSNFGGKYIEIMSSLMFSNKYDFRSRIPVPVNKKNNNKGHSAILYNYE